MVMVPWHDKQWRLHYGSKLLQVEMGSITLVTGWEAQTWALAQVGIDLFSSAKEVTNV